MKTQLQRIVFLLLALGFVSSARAQTYLDQMKQALNESVKELAGRTQQEIHVQSFQITNTSDGLNVVFMITGNEEKAFRYLCKIASGESQPSQEGHSGSHEDRPPAHAGHSASHTHPASPPESRSVLDCRPAKPQEEHQAHAH